MILSLLRKFIYALVWLGVISFLAFWLSKQVPGDEILDYLSIESSAYSTSLSPVQQREAYERVAQKRGLDQPFFYFSFHERLIPASLNSIFPIEDRQAVKTWIRQSHQIEEALVAHTSMRNLLKYSCNLSAYNAFADSCCRVMNVYLMQQDIHLLHQGTEKLYHQALNEARDTMLLNLVAAVHQNVRALTNVRSLTSFDYWPAFSWNGTKNQYHHWISSLLTFQPLVSLVDGRNAWAKILEALKWTLLLNGLAFFLAMILGVGIGIWSGVRHGSAKEKWLSIFLFTLFAIPSFWLATLLVYLFSSGEWLSVFPSGGLGNYQVASSLLEKWGIISFHLILPVCCLSIGSLAYISRQMKQSVQHEFSQSYVTSLRTMGISERTILRKHVIRNALFPMITMIGHALPAILSGSLIIEVIFSIPGMGRLMFTSLMARDWPVVFPVLMLGAAVTVLAYTLTDIIYKWVDPRVKTTE